MREHFPLTIQPLDAPPDPRHLIQAIEQFGSEDMLMYASDYPHLHATDPEKDFLPDIPASLARKIRSENARSFYKL